MATHNNSMAPVKKRLRDMDVDEFFNANCNSDSDDPASDNADTDFGKHKKSKFRPHSESKVLQTIAASPSSKHKHQHGVGLGLHMQQPQVIPKKKAKSKNILNSDVKMESKNSLASALKENDPEFYDFLKGQDKNLLDNLEDLSDISGEESSANEDDSEQNKPAKKKKKSVKDDDAFERELLKMSSGEDTDSENEDSEHVHTLPDKLEVASDDSTDEDDVPEAKDVTKKGGILLTHKIIDKWTQDIQRQPSRSVFKEIVSAFHAAVCEAAGTDETQNSKYRVEGGTVFNSVIRLCLTQIVPALQSILQLPSLAEVRQTMSDKSTAWKNIKAPVKSYISDLLSLLSQLSDAAMVNVILKHVHKLVIFYASFSKLTRFFLKRMIKMWTTGEETTRVLAFLCISKIVRLKQDELLEPCLKQMYVAYVSNCKFTSPSTLPLINFMQRSLVEMFTIDQTVAYQYAFVYLRQLAIHLRNAISVTKKDTCQTVYNWQYIHCLGIWVQLICNTYPSDVLQPLVYPLTQTIIGVIKLLPTARYYPLRFHCVRLLNQLSIRTNTFIPTLPFLLEIFDQVDFNKRHKNISMKPFNFAVILKFSKAQLGEKSFKDGLIDQLYEHLLESYNIQAHSIGFPELIIPSVLQLKSFLKKCKIANYCKQIKQIVDKVQEQSKFIVEKRKRSNLNLTDFQSVSQWESELATSGTPLRKYYTSWRKLRDRELQHQVADKDFISGAAIDIPTIDRKKPKKATAEEREDYSKLFENSSDSDDETRFMLKEERPEKEGRKQEDANSDSDEYSDFDDDELEQLAQSASSDDEENDIDKAGDDSSEDDEEESENELPEKISVQSRRSAQSPKRFKTSHSNISKENGVDEQDVVEDFALSDFESD